MIVIMFNIEGIYGCKHMWISTGSLVAHESQLVLLLTVWFSSATIQFYFAQSIKTWLFFFLGLTPPKYTSLEKTEKRQCCVILYPLNDHSVSCFWRQARGFLLSAVKRGLANTVYLWFTCCGSVTSPGKENSWPYRGFIADGERLCQGLLS